MKNKKIKDTIDAQLVEAWMGSDATIYDYADIIASLANGEYKPSDCRKEVSDYNSIND
jgi:hypothetical protein